MIAPLEARWFDDERWHKPLDDLRRQTLDYWRTRRHGDESTAIQTYVEELLPRQLFNCRTNVTAQSCHTLVLLIGHSPEPLLQAVAAMQPTRIVLILNTKYPGLGQDGGIQAGRTRGELFRRWINLLYKCRDWSPPTVDLEVASDTPEEVFQGLRRTVIDDIRDGKQVVVDVTGSKKSMVAGAFLFAAYTGARVSYVDFGDYDTNDRHPTGLDARIHELANPYERFRLRDWEQVQQLYSSYRFGLAAETIQRVLPAICEPLFTDDDTQAAQRLQQLVQVYAHWDAGNFMEANAAASRLGVTVPITRLPPSIYALSRPPRSDANLDARNIDLDAYMQSNTHLLHHGWDELAKIGRQIRLRAEYRSALLRAAALDELLLRARATRLWYVTSSTGWFERLERRGLTSRAWTELAAPSHDDRIALLNALYQFRSTGALRRALKSSGSAPRLEVHQGMSGGIRATLMLSDGAPRLPEYDTGPDTLAGDRLTDLRDKAIHRIAEVSEADARRAFQTTLNNLENFASEWTAVGDTGRLGMAPTCRLADFDALPWGDAIAACGVTFLPFSPD